MEEGALLQPVLGCKQGARQKDLLTQFTPSGRSILDYKQPAAAAAFRLSLPAKVVRAEYGRERSALIHARHAGNTAIEWEREIVVIFNLGVARDPFLPI